MRRRLRKLPAASSSVVGELARRLVVVVGEEAGARDLDAAGRGRLVEGGGDRAASVRADRGQGLVGESVRGEAAAGDFDADRAFVTVTLECPAPADVDVGAVARSGVGARA